MHTRRSLLKDLDAAGVARDGVVLIHSSFKSIGAVDGGPEAVLDVLCGFFARDGLLLLPALSYNLDAANPEFDVRSTPVNIGLLPELFRQRPGVRRSLHPTHSVAGIGRGAEGFLAGHENFDSPCAPASPWGKLVDAEAKILFLGSPLQANTMLHGVEERAGVPAILTEAAETLYVTDYAGRRFPVPSRRHTGDPEHSQFYAKLVPEFSAAGVLWQSSFGDAAMHILDAAPAARIALARLAEDPGCFTRP